MSRLPLAVHSERRRPGGVGGLSREANSPGTRRQPSWRSHDACSTGSRPPRGRLGKRTGPALGLRADQSAAPVYTALLVAQVAFYTVAFVGWLLRDRVVPVRGFRLALYVVFMHAAVFPGVVRLLTGRQSVNWARAERAAVAAVRTPGVPAR